MGMYDTVLPEINLIITKCPACNHKLSIDQEWQTKSYDRMLSELSIRTLYNDCNNFEAHMICDKCNEYVKAYFNKDSIKLEYNNKTKYLNNKYLEIYKLLRMKEKHLWDDFEESSNDSNDS